MMLSRGVRHREPLAGDWECRTSLRVGVDIANVSQVAESLTQFGERYALRVFTPGELTDSAGEPEVRARSLAGRFAAKEATMKVLRPEGEGLDWRSIEVRSMGAGWPAIHLRGAAQRLADRAGIRDLSVSLSHEGNLATAVVVAICQL